MGCSPSRHQIERDHMARDFISGYPHGILTFVLDLIFPTWAVRQYVDNVMWTHRERWLNTEKNARDLAQKGVSINREVSSGSSTEGLRLPNIYNWHNDGLTVDVDHSDFDTLLVDAKRHLAVNQQHAQEIGTHLVMDSSHTYPGFMRIQVIDSTKELDKYCIKKRVNGKDVIYLSPEQVKWNIAERLMDNQGDIVPTGPALTQDQELVRKEGAITATSTNSVDNVYAIRCRKWPHIAEPFCCRHRPSGWPTQETREKIVNYGIHVVGVPYKKSLHPDIEWRLSYSGPEVYLASSLTLQQRQVYIILKYLSKAFLKHKPCFFSYLLKTTFFWTCEEIPQRYWTAANLSVCLLAIIDKLKHFLSEGHIPNYFIPQSNLIGHQPVDHIQTLFLAIHDMRSDPLQIIAAQKNIRLAFHAYPLSESFDNILGVLKKFFSQGSTSDFDKAGFRPLMSNIETIVIINHAYQFGRLCDYYEVTHTLENFLRLYWLFPEVKNASTFKQAHKRRALYQKCCNIIQGIRSCTFPTWHFTMFFREAVCRITGEEGLFLKEHCILWEPLAQSILHEWISHFPGNEDFVSKYIKPSKDVEIQDELNRDNLPEDVFQPTTSQLYSPLDDASYHQCVMIACRALWHVVAAASGPPCRSCFVHEILTAICLFKEILPKCPHDPCVVAEYLNLLVFLSSRPLNGNLQNAFLQCAALMCSKTSKSPRHIENDLLQQKLFDIKIYHIDPTQTVCNTESTDKTFSQFELPAVERNLAAFINSQQTQAGNKGCLQNTETCIPYEVYMVFLYDVLKANLQHHTSVKEQPISTVLSQIVDKNEALLMIHAQKQLGQMGPLMHVLRHLGGDHQIIEELLPQLEKHFESSTLSCMLTRSEFHYLNGIALLYSKQYIQAYTAFMRAGNISPTCSTYNRYARISLATSLWIKYVEENNKCRTMVLFKQNYLKELISLIYNERSSSCSCDKKMRHLGQNYPKDCLEAEAVRRLECEANLGSDLDPFTFRRVYLDLFTLVLPHIFSQLGPICEDVYSKLPLKEFDLD